MPVELVNHFLSLLIVIGLVAIALFVISLIFIPKVDNLPLAFVSKYGMWLGFAVALGAMLTSLYYSEVVGYAPCVLCWYQRIFLYSEAFILGVALWKRDAGIRLYSLVLSGIGGLIAAYHVLLERGITPGVPCPANGPSCLTRYVYEYGFVTIPVMSLTAFILIFIALYFYRSRPQ